MTIKPCPFCGKNKAVKNSEKYTARFVVCEFCGAYGPSCFSIDLAIEEWNKRV